MSKLKAVVSSGHEHEFEAQPGLPERLPADEKVLWQGSPDWLRLARERFHLSALAGYFAAILVLRAGFVISEGESVGEALMAVTMLLPLVVFALGIVASVAWLSSRTTVYTITDKRVVMRIGIVLSLTFNLPLRQLEAADVKLTKDGHGNIPLTLGGTDRIAIVHLWPHVRPWRVAKPEPMLCCIPDATHAAEVLHRAWTAEMNRNAGTATAPSARANAGETAQQTRVRQHDSIPQLAID